LYIFVRVTDYTVRQYCITIFLHIVTRVQPEKEFYNLEKMEKKV